MRKFILTMCLLALSGCGDLGTAFLGAGITQGISFLATSAEEDSAQAHMWRGEQRILVAECRTMMMAKVRELEEGDLDKMERLCNKVIKFNERQQPKLLA